MRRVLAILIVLAVVAVAGSCGKKHELVTSPSTGQTSSLQQFQGPENLAPSGELPPATVKALPLPPRTAALALGRLTTDAGGATLTPSTLEATLRPGECITEHKTLFLPPDVQPARLDMVILMDLTGSMGGELNNVKVNSANIMTQVRGLIADSDFGVMSHMDYEGTHGGCGYSSIYGNAPPGDYPYRLDQPITSNVATVTTAINGLVLGNGRDTPEDYTRVLYETYSDPAVAWRPGAKRIVLQWGDAIPHDCAYNGILGGSSTTGPDPGRNEIDNDADDLAILPVLDGMKANNTTLVSLHSGGVLSLWKAYAQKTNGDAFQINTDGTVPGGTDIAAFIASLVQETNKFLKVLTLEVCDPAYKDWLKSVTPASYTDITLDHDQTFDFDIEICVPPGTPAGEYCFDICAIGDGAEFARQRVCITVVTTVDVPFDVHPTSCPNPLTPTPNDNQVMPAAILGTGSLNVHDIDPASVRLEGVPALRWSYEDVATPYMPLTGKSKCWECTTAGSDGFTDLTLKFNPAAVKAALGDLTNGQCVVVHLTGMKFDGTLIKGEDVMIVRMGGRGIITP